MRRKELLERIATREAQEGLTEVGRFWKVGRAVESITKCNNKRFCIQK